MLTFEQIKELIELVGAHRLSGVEIERAGFRLRVDGNAANGEVGVGPVIAPTPPAVAASTTPAAAPPPPSAAPAAPAAPATASEEPPPGVHRLTSPIVGTFYTAPSPDSDPFVEIGQRVRQGQVVCIIEAMKLMNEIESDVDGEIVEILPQNGQPVEYGEPLFSIKTR